MVSYSFAGPLGAFKGDTSKGVALSTTISYTLIPANAKHLFLKPRNFSTAVVAGVLLNPYLTVLKTADALATAPTDYSSAAQDGSAATDVVLSSLDTAANLDFLYVGARVPFGGVQIDVDAANGTASVITVKYRKSDLTWADITATDGTASGGASMAVDGAVTWTAPSDWIASSLREAGDTTLGFTGSSNKLYWTRWQFSAALDSSTTLNSMLAKNKEITYFELVSGDTFEMALEREYHTVLQAVTDAGTANLIVNYATDLGSNF